MNTEDELKFAVFHLAVVKRNGRKAMAAPLARIARSWQLNRVGKQENFPMSCGLILPAVSRVPPAYNWSTSSRTSSHPHFELLKFRGFFHSRLVLVFQFFCEILVRWTFVVHVNRLSLPVCCSRFFALQRSNRRY